MYLPDNIEKLNKSSWNTLDSIILSGWKKYEKKKKYENASLWLFQKHENPRCNIITPPMFFLRLLFITCFLLSAKEQLKLSPTETQTQRAEIGQKCFGIIWYLQLTS